MSKRYCFLKTNHETKEITKQRLAYLFGLSYESHYYLEETDELLFNEVDYSLLPKERIEYGALAYPNNEPTEIVALYAFVIIYNGAKKIGAHYTRLV